MEMLSADQVLLKCINEDVPVTPVAPFTNMV